MQQVNCFLNITGLTIIYFSAFYSKSYIHYTLNQETFLQLQHVEI